MQWRECQAALQKKDEEFPESYAWITSYWPLASSPKIGKDAIRRSGYPASASISVQICQRFPNPEKKPSARVP
ncbi:MAG: hypothetical protein ACREXY_20295, partial [Gammaproteobacteria bacterium]